MKNTPYVLLLAAITAVVCNCCKGSPKAPPSPSAPRDAFVRVNGVRLHYIDWGGVRNNETLLFLAAMGSDAHTFDGFAKRFTDSYHVVGLTRRGHGRSERGEGKLDLDTFVGDILQFLDAINVSQAVIVGHSFAGAEMTLLATRHGEHVQKLVYLDAGVDYSSSRELIQRDPTGNLLRMMNDPLLGAMFEMVFETRPDYAKIEVPALSFYAFPDSYRGLPPDTDEAARREADRFLVEEIGAWRRNEMERFRREVRHARVVELLHTGHSVHLERPDDLEREMRKFLSAK